MTSDELSLQVTRLNDRIADCLYAHVNAARDTITERKRLSSPLYAKIELLTRQSGDPDFQYEAVIRSSNPDSARVEYENPLHRRRYAHLNAMFQKILNPGAREDYCLITDLESFLREWGRENSFVDPNPTIDPTFFSGALVVPIKGLRWTQPDGRLIPPGFGIQPFRMDQSLIGFLTVDSKERGIFDHDCDLHYLRSIACEIFELLRTYCTAYSALHAAASRLPKRGPSDSDLPENRF
jgi:hypothetical protein